MVKYILKVDVAEVVCATVKSNIWLLAVNPFSPNSDQDPFSPNNIQILSTDKLWELLKWSPKQKCLDRLSNSLNSFCKEMYRDQFGEFVSRYWGFKS